MGNRMIATNVHEWCADWHDTDYYSRSPERNPAGPGHVRGANAEERVAETADAWRLLIEKGFY